MATATYTVDPPAVQVTLTAADLNADVQTVTLYRIADGQTVAVRTAINIFAGGGFSASDAEPPFGIPVMYRAQQYDASGNVLGYTDSVTVTVPSVAPWIGYLSDPLDETSPVKVVMTDTAGTAPSRTTAGTLYQVGSTAVVLAGVQAGLTGLDMGFYTLSDADDAAVQGTLQQANGLVLIRTAPGFGVLIPRALYCFAGTANPVYQNGDGSVWTNAVSEVTPNTQPLINANASWQTYMNAFATWNDFNAAYATWLDAEANPPTVIS
jgi:hypothetical protein